MPPPKCSVHKTVGQAANEFRHELDAPNAGLTSWFYSTKPQGFTPWIYSSIGTMYLAFAIVGGALSMAVPMELQEPGLQFFANGHSYNALMAGHGRIMIFHDHGPRSSAASATCCAAHAQAASSNCTITSVGRGS
jgi:hypothetical protein